MDTREVQAARGMVNTIIKEVERIERECTGLDECLFKIKSMLTTRLNALEMRCRFEAEPIDNGFSINKTPQ